MRVRITTAFVEEYGVVYNPGQELVVSNERGISLLQRGVAERLEPEPEMAVAAPRGQQAVRTARAVK